MEGAQPLGRARQHSDGAERDRRITLRLTRSELAEVERRCLQAGGGELAPYLRRILLAPQPGSRAITGVAPPACRDLASWERTDRLDRIHQNGRAAQRLHTILVRVNATELAELERHRALAHVREMSTYLRTAVLAQHPPQAPVPELNRTAWLALAEHLACIQELAGRLEALADRRRGGLAGLVGRGRLEETLAACLEELRAQDVAIQALRRSLLGSDRGRR